MPCLCHLGFSLLVWLPLGMDWEADGSKSTSSPVSLPPALWTLTLHRDVFLVAVFLPCLPVLHLTHIISLLIQGDVWDGEQQGRIVGVGLEAQLPLHLGGIVVDVLTVQHKGVALFIMELGEVQPVPLQVLIGVIVCIAAQL